MLPSDAGRRLVTMLTGLGLLFAGTHLAAAVPPAKSVRDRLASARAVDGDRRIRIEVRLSLADAEPMASTTVDGAVAPEDLMALRDSLGQWSEDFPLDRLGLVLTESDPWKALESAHGAIDVDQTDIRVHDDQFLYVYGDNPLIGITRDLSMIRLIEFGEEASRTTIRTRGRLGEDTPYPEEIVILERGRPVARAELSWAEETAEDPGPSE